MKEQVLNHKQPLSEQQSKKVVYVEMFRAGPQISSTGQKLVFDESDLDQVVGSYDPIHHEAPLIIGHDQQDDTPALGWVRKVWRKGKELWGKVELTPKAEQLIKDGVFKKVSSSFYLPEAETNPTPGKLSLRHLGLVSVPAVKGLTAFSEESEQQTITITPSEGESSISFKEHLGKNQTMARKKTKPETPASVSSVIEHTEGGGMTVNINIGGGDKPKSNVYDDSGNQISETGAPAEYDMDYGMESDTEADPAMNTADDSSSDDLGLEDGGPDDTDGTDGADATDGMDGTDGTDSTDPTGDDGGDMAPDAGMNGGADDSSTEPSEEGDGAPDDGTEDISGDMEGDDQKIAQLASEYEIDELIKALALKTDAASMMEGQGMSYGEMPESLKKAMEAKKKGEGESEDEKKKKKKEEDSEDMGEKCTDAGEPSGAGEPSSEKVKGADEPKGEQVYAEEEAAEEDEEVSEHGEGCKDYEEDEDEKKKKMMKSDMSKETTPEEATGTLDHSESAMGVQGQNDLQARVAELEEELARQKKLMREKEISDFCETLYGEGKLTQQIVSKTDLVRFMETLNNKNSVNFSETGKASQFDFFKGVLEKLPSMVSFEEFATPASAPKSRKQPSPSADGYVYDPATADLHAQALDYAEEKGVEYTIALKAVLSNS